MRFSYIYYKGLHVELLTSAISVGWEILRTVVSPNVGRPLLFPELYVVNGGVHGVWGMCLGAILCQY